VRFRDCRIGRKNPYVKSVVAIEPFEFTVDSAGTERNVLSYDLAASSLYLKCSCVHVSPRLVLLPQSQVCPHFGPARRYVFDKVAAVGNVKFTHVYAFRTFIRFDIQFDIKVVFW